MRNGYGNRLTLTYLQKAFEFPRSIKEGTEAEASKILAILNLFSTF